MQEVRIPLINMNALLRAGLAPLVWWALAVGLATSGGYPGVVCLTPIAWVLMIPAGYLYIHQARNQLGRRPLLGAALLGGVLGLLYGLLFVGVSTLYMPVEADEVGKMAALSLMIVVGGILIGAAISAASARVVLRRYQH